LETSWIYSTNVDANYKKESLKIDDPVKSGKKRSKRRAQINLNTSMSGGESIHAESKAIISTRESPAIGVKESIELPQKKLIKKKKPAEVSTERQGAEQGDKQND